MQAIRKIVPIKNNIITLELPAELFEGMVEVIVLPVSDASLAKEYLDISPDETNGLPYSLAEGNDTQLAKLLQEPTWDIEQIDQQYHFDASTVVGQWPGEESIEYLISLLNA